VDDIAAEVAEQFSAEFEVFATHLQMNVAAVRAILAMLLVREDFDVSQVRAVFSRNVGSVGLLLPDLTTEQKQTIYSTARMSENRLWARRRIVWTELQSAEPTSQRRRELRAQLTRLDGELRVAEGRAAQEIFRQMNEMPSMGEQAGRPTQIDLHGLHVREAEERLGQLMVALPHLPQGMVLITGRGLHSNISNNSDSNSRGETQTHSALKQAVLQFLQRRGLAHEPVPGNDGAIHVLCTTSNVADAHA
jgi:DNA-nicking Smr family endonuclease